MPSELSPSQSLQYLLKTVGVGLVLPPFCFHIWSDVPVVAQGLSQIYPNAIQSPTEDGFFDFHVAVRKRWHGWKWVSVFESDIGDAPFTPLGIDEGYALLEWGLNWCVAAHTNRWLMIHSAVLEKNGAAVLLPAPSGSGKSTLCAALMYSGWRLLSDEMALFDPESGLLTPAPRGVSLKNNAIEVIRHRYPQAVFGPVAMDTSKGVVVQLQPSAVSAQSAFVPARLRWVVSPRYEAGAPLSVESITKAETMVTLTSNSFNYQVHGLDGFQMLARVLGGVDGYQLSYSNLDEALGWFERLAEVV